jgi:hypothetical protein
MTSSSLADRVSAIKQITDLFRIERLVYLFLTTIALLLLIGGAISLMFDEPGPSPAILTLLFGSSGLITVSFARLLRMWDRAVDLLSEALPEQRK